MILNYLECIIPYIFTISKKDVKNKYLLFAFVILLKRIAIISVEIQEMINTTTPEQQESKRNVLLRRQKEELKQADMKLVIQLDQKVFFF